MCIFTELRGVHALLHWHFLESTKNDALKIPYRHFVMFYLYVVWSTAVLHRKGQFLLRISA